MLLPFAVTYVVSSQSELFIVKIYADNREEINNNLQIPSLILIFHRLRDCRYRIIERS